MDKTIVVSVERLARHRLYKRVIRLTTKFKAHDETNDARIGDTVLIEESRPMSATKRWRLVSVIQRAGEHGLPGESVVARRRRSPRPSTPPHTRAATRAAEAEAPPIRSRPPKPRRGDGEAESDRGRGPGGRHVIQPQTRLKVADNTGARSIQCIRVMGRSPRRPPASAT